MIILENEPQDRHLSPQGLAAQGSSTRKCKEPELDDGGQVLACPCVSQPKIANTRIRMEQKRGGSVLYILADQPARTETQDRPYNTITPRPQPSGG